MSDDKNNLGDDLNDALDGAKKTVKNAGEKASDFAEDAVDKTKEVAGDVKESVSDFASDAKDTAKDFTNSAKEAFSGAGGDNKKVLAGILAILLGAFGVHKFILGYQKEGLILLGVTLLGYATTCIAIGMFFFWIPGVIGLIEGIMYLTKSDEEFYSTYQENKKPWF